MIDGEQMPNGPRLDKEIIINSTPQETRVALLENKNLAELYIELASEKPSVGNIYIGKVVRVLPGMQAAFVDIGLEKAAFLYVSDVETGDSSLLPTHHDGEDVEDSDFRKRQMPPIETLLSEGQEILVQVSKEPLGRKGSRITQHISLPGRYVVYLPTVDHVGISRRIQEEEERLRLRGIVEEGRGEERGGFIVRTVSEGCGKEEIEQEMSFLIRLWNEVERKIGQSSAPNLLHCDLDVTYRAIRDLHTPDVRKIVLDSPEDYRKIIDFVDTFMHHSKPVVELYNRQEPIFHFYGIEIELSKVFEKRVWLKSGGYIVIEMTEALTAIDVNTGSFVGKRNLEDTILKTNLEAAKEIAYQLRLRNIGGIIIIDFIDMEQEENRLEVFETLKAEFEADKARTNLLQISSLGLVEMTRKRVGESLARSLSDSCPYCEGKGYVKSKSTVASEILRELRRKRAGSPSKEVVVEAHPDIVSYIFEEERASLEALEKSFGKPIVLRSRKNPHQEEFAISGC